MAQAMTERIELLISRRLDGRITESEQLELDRALIRYPEWRAMFEATERIDAVCGATIREELVGVGDGGGIEVSARAMSSIGEKVTGSRRRSRLWWLMPSAVAACIVWLMVTEAFEVGGERQRPAIVEVGTPDRGIAPAGGLTGGSLAPTLARPALGDATLGDSRRGFRRTSLGPDVMERRRDSNMYGIIGEDGRIYLIELERVRSYRFPYGGHPDVRLVRNDL